MQNFLYLHQMSTRLYRYSGGQSPRRDGLDTMLSIISSVAVFKKSKLEKDLQFCLKFILTPGSRVLLQKLTVPQLGHNTTRILLNSKMLYRDFRLPPRCCWDLRSSGMWRSVAWSFFTDVSGQHISSTSKGQEPFILGLFTLQDVADILSRNVGRQLPHDAA
jgi:hypothetical protein